MSAYPRKSCRIHGSQCNRFLIFPRNRNAGSQSESLLKRRASTSVTPVLQREAGLLPELSFSFRFLSAEATVFHDPALLHTARCIDRSRSFVAVTTQFVPYVPSCLAASLTQVAYLLHCQVINSWDMLQFQEKMLIEYQAESPIRAHGHQKYVILTLLKAPFICWAVTFPQNLTGLRCPISCTGLLTEHSHVIAHAFHRHRHH